MNTLLPCSSFMPQLASKARLKPTASWLLLANEDDYVGLGRLVETDGVQSWEMQDGRTLQLSEVSYWSTLFSVPFLRGEVQASELFDEDGYPSLYAIGLVKNWAWTDPLGWLELVHRLWQHRSTHFGIKEEADKWVYLIGTAGWSGNEALIKAMEKNDMLWFSCWRRSSAGGHYVFEVEKADAA